MRNKTEILKNKIELQLSVIRLMIKRDTIDVLELKNRVDELSLIANQASSLEYMREAFKSYGSTPSYGVINGFRGGRLNADALR